MKRLKILSLLILSLLLTAGVFLGGTIVSPSVPKASAEIPAGCPGGAAGPPAPGTQCPVCYERKPANYVMINPPIVTTVKTCNGDPNFIQILQHERGGTMNAGTCYIIQAGVPGITGGDPFGSPTCDAAEAARVDKGTPMNGDGTPTTQPASSGGTPASNTGGATPTSTSGPGGNAGQSNGDVAPPGVTEDQKKAAQVEVSQQRKDAGTCTTPQDCIQKNPLVKGLGKIFDILSAVVGIAIVGTVIFGGIRYSASGGDPNAVAKAKKMIAAALLALVAYIFLYAFLQWLVPGGLF